MVDKIFKMDHKMKQIIAIGSGGLDNKNPAIELYILAQSPVINPKICFLGTASGDDIGYIEYFYEFFNRFNCKTTHLSLFNPPTKDIRDFVLEQDIIFVGGGHSRNAMTIWKSWGVDKILQEAYDDGIILSGGSAGSVVWFDECITDSVPGKLTVMPCLGILPYSNCPHYLSTARRAAYEKEMLAGNIKAGYAIDDMAALHFIDGKSFRSVSLHNDTGSYYSRLNNGSFEESPIDNSYLDEENMKKLVWEKI